MEKIGLMSLKKVTAHASENSARFKIKENIKSWVLGLFYNTPESY